MIIIMTMTNKQQKTTTNERKGELVLHFYRTMNLANHIKVFFLYTFILPWLRT